MLLRRTTTRVPPRRWSPFRWYSELFLPKPKTSSRKKAFPTVITSQHKSRTCHLSSNICIASVIQYQYRIRKGRQYRNCKRILQTVHQKPYQIFWLKEALHLFLSFTYHRRPCWSGLVLVQPYKFSNFKKPPDEFEPWYVVSLIKT